MTEWSSDKKQQLEGPGSASVRCYKTSRANIRLSKSHIENVPTWCLCCVGHVACSNLRCSRRWASNEQTRAAVPSPFCGQCQEQKLLENTTSKTVLILHPNILFRHTFWCRWLFQQAILSSTCLVLLFVLSWHRARRRTKEEGRRSRHLLKINKINKTGSVESKTVPNLNKLISSEYLANRSYNRRNEVGLNSPPAHGNRLKHKRL